MGQILLLIFGIAALLLPSGPVVAQTDVFLSHNAKPVSKSRYVGIEGTPYYFPDWMNGNVLLNNGKVVENVMLNYNGLTHEIEILSDDNIFALDPRGHLKIDVLREHNPDHAFRFSVDSLTFIRGFHRDLADRYATILYLGEHLALVKDFHVGKSEQDFNDLERSEMNAFRDRSAFYIRRAGDLILLRPQKKRILEAFENDVRISDFLSKEKPDLDSEEGLLRLVKFADTLPR